ncbi:Ankyrin repeat-containing protein [Melia azedarach]|uniref:Ankyrin repeat-containing protein n=1 Tax=Melia azedarach TaxID=155640 RepID=A0ACC1WZC4_MELAZ|nr:Ankyrin repeat-containing protein [Melia azedarach]
MDELLGVSSLKAYDAAIYEDWEEMKHCYTEENYHSLIFPMTVYGDTPIHMAVYSKRRQPLQHFLDLIVKFEDRFVLEKITSQNALGNTPLHKAAFAGNYEAATLLVAKTREFLGVEKTRELLEMKNNQGETALFKAASQGQAKLMKFLASRPGQMTPDKKLADIHRRGNGKPRDTILQATIQEEHFGTALALLDLDITLLEDDDRSGMTCLQLLASIPHAFRSGYKMGFWKNLVYSFFRDQSDDIGSIDDDRVDKNWETQKGPADLESGVPVGNQNDETEISIEDESSASKRVIFWRFLFEERPSMGNLWRQKRTHVFALKLTKLLTEKDRSWEKTSTEESSTYFRGTDERGGDQNHQEGEGTAKVVKQTLESSSGQREIALLAATRKGIIEIVMEILRVYPGAVEHRSHKRQNILHLAVLHRQKKIFDLVKKMKVPMTNLVNDIDIYGYCVLHCAADMTYYPEEGTRPGPAYQLQDELKWFKRVLKIVPPHFRHHHDKKHNKTAKQLFREQHQKQLEDAQRWIKETAQSCSAVAVLVATVVFAAAYTVPGGSNERGLPNFLDSPLFLFFTVMDIVSLTGSLTAVVMFLSILSSPFELPNFFKSLPRKLTFGFTMLFLSVATTMLAFTATVLLIIRLEPQRWTSTLVYTAAFIPVSILALTQFPLYVAFMDTSMKISKAIGKFLPLKRIRRLFPVRRRSA